MSETTNVTYFDNAATTKVLPEVAEIMCKVVLEAYGNPSSLHAKGFEAQKIVDGVRKDIAHILKVPTGDLYFTSGGTEANNMAILGIARAYKRSGNHILVSAIEHPSIMASAKSLVDEGFVVEEIPCLESGQIDQAAFLAMIKPETLLVSIMQVNNEIGTIQPIEELAKMMKSVKSDLIFHVDGVQGFGKMTLNPSRVGVDLYSLSGHKIHGPKGVGAIYISSKLKYKPLIYGGHQQKGYRSGTENVPGIAGLGVAAKAAYDNLEHRHQHITQIRQHLLVELAKIEGVRINSPLEGCASHILNIRVEDVKSEVLLHSLEDHQIYVSTGSACSSNKKEQSSTLKSLGQSLDQMDQAIRLSFSFENTLEDVQHFTDTLVSLLPMLRRFVRK